MIVAWKSGDDSPSDADTPRAQRPLAARRAERRPLVVRATRGATRDGGPPRRRSGGPLVLAGTVEHGREQSFKLKTRLWLYVQRPATSSTWSAAGTDVPARPRDACSWTPRASVARRPRVDAPASAARRHRQRARPRRAHRPERAVPRPRGARRSGSSRLGSRSSATARTSSRPRSARGWAPTSSSSPAASARRTTTAPSSSSRGSTEPPAARRRRARGARSRRSRAPSRSGSAGPTPTSRPASASRRRCPRALPPSGSPARRPGSCSSRSGTRRRRPARPARRSSGGSGRRARDGAAAAAARARAAARTAGAAVLRRERVGRRAGARGGGRRRRGRRGDDLRARLRDPRRPRRRAGRGGPRRTRSRQRWCRRSSAGCSRATSGRSRSSCSRSAAREGLTLATAESCTGGLVAERLTDVPGSSDVFLGGDRRVRERGEGAAARRSRRAPRAHGAVSAEAAAAMASGARARLGADVAVARHGRRRPGRRHGGEARRPRLRRASRRPDGDARRRLQLPRRPRGDPAPRGRRGAPPRPASAWHRVVTHGRDTSAASVDAAMTASPLLRPPAARRRRRRARVVAGVASCADGVVPPEHLHVTLAFLGSRPAGELAGDRPGLCARPPLRAERPELDVARLPRDAKRRDARLDDEGGRATAFADDLCGRLEALGRLPSESSGPGCRTSPCPASASGRASARRCPSSAPFSPSDAAVYLSRLRPTGAQYEVLESAALGG